MKARNKVRADAPQSKTVSRRGLLLTLMSGAKKIHKDIQDEPFKRQVARPPSTVNEFTLEALCDGCGKCEQACPQQVISMIAGKPELELDYNFCSQCGECKGACHTEALSGKINSTGVIPSFENNCSRMISGQCNHCATQCPTNAIGFNGNQPHVASHLCNGCGRCRMACPVNGITFSLATIGLH